MSSECRPVDELVEIALLPEDDPQRIHLEDCSRCRTELAAYHAFAAGLDLPEGANAGDATSRISAVLQEEVLRERAAEEHGVSNRDRPSGISLRRLLDRLRAPSLRPVYAVAAAALLVFVVQQTIQRTHLDDRPDTLRGENSVPSIIELNDAEIGETGAVALSWKPFPSAETYEVIFYRSDLSEIARIDAGSELSLLLEPKVAQDLVGQEAVLLWEVYARRGDDELATSPVASVRLNSGAH